MKKLSKKELARKAEMFSAVKVAKDIYKFENAESYISNLKKYNEKTFVCEKIVNNLIADIKGQFPNSKGCMIEHLYYSAGVYGCTGRLSKVVILDENYNYTENELYIFFLGGVKK